MNLAPIGTRVVHPEDERQVGTVIEHGKPDTYNAHQERVRVKWDDRPYGDGYVRKGKRTWVSVYRLREVRA